MVPQTWVYSFTAGWGSSISLAAGKEGEEEEEVTAPALSRSQECEGNYQGAEEGEASIHSR